jgi:hypothetical protein
MQALISTWPRRLLLAILAFIITLLIAFALSGLTTADPLQSFAKGEYMMRTVTFPVLAFIAIFSLLSVSASKSASAVPKEIVATSPISDPPKPFLAQVVGVQWLNPLQRRDYSTEWQLLWTLGIVKANKDDDMVKAKPQKYLTLQSVGSIADGNNGSETFVGYHEKFVWKLISKFYLTYFSNSSYFYNASSENKKTWRELAGIHVEYALPVGKLDSFDAAKFTMDTIVECFRIGNVNSPTLWSRDTSPDVRVTMGGADAGFTSLTSALNYLQVHPNETVWVMNWDAPSRPKDEQINENMVLLVLAGPDYKTERDALAWISYPAIRVVDDFENKKELHSRAIQAWHATLNDAAHNAGKQGTDIGYVIHDADVSHSDSPNRLGNLAQTLAMDVAELDFSKQTFNTPALLGEMGAGTALTNIALGIAYANHFGKNVLVAGTSRLEHPTAVLVVPPAKVRPIDPNAPWFRARGENNAYLMWWGIRHDAEPGMQGYSK